MCDQEVIKKARYDGRSKKRKWEERRTDKGEALYATNKEKVEERVKRRKYALLLGYSGVDYYGMQRNPTMKTIEEELFKALLKTNFITEEAFNQVQVIQFQRAARTDKGVSAARQVVSLKLPEVISSEKINELLPEEIRLFGYKRVTKGFNSKSQCDARTYLYMLPTIAFSKNKNEDIINEHFRLDDACFKEVNNTLNKFLGTKNYHNFTSKKKPNDPSANRYMTEFYCETPFLKNNMEFAVIKVKGQSFMLHQIRKMVGLAIAVVKGQASEDIFKKVFTSEKVNLPKAPGLGLVLDFVHYDRYNRRYGDDGVHQKLEWAEVADIVENFKEKYIYPTIVETEIKENSMMSWISNKLLTHNYDKEEDDKNNEENDCSDDEDTVNSTNIKNVTTATT